MARMQSSEHGSIEARRSELGKIVSLGKCPHKKRKSLVPEQELAIRSDKIIVGLSYDSNK